MSKAIIEIEVSDDSTVDANEFAKRLMAYAEETDFLHYFRKHHIPKNSNEEDPIIYWIKEQ